MSRTDIVEICNLSINLGYKPSIYRDVRIKYGYPRVKDVIKRLDLIKRQNNGQLPLNYIE